MKLLFVVNPISGGVDKEPFLKKAKALCEKYGVEYYIFKTTGDNDQKNLEKILKDYQPDRVASVGGDGTTLFTSIVLKDTGIPMGIIPLGSANGMAVELFVNLDPIEALKDILLSKVVAGLDILLINDKYHCIHIGDVGINAKIVESYSKDKNRGMTTYAKYFLEELNKLNPFYITIKTKNSTIKENGLMVGICNARKYGTGIPLNINGNPMDGNFEIVIVKNINLNSMIKAGLSKFDPSFYDKENIEVISTDEVEISFDQPRLLQLDGEVIDEFQDIKINILKGAVKLITHNENEYLS